MKLNKFLPLLLILVTGTAFSYNNSYDNRYDNRYNNRHHNHVSRDARMFENSIRRAARNFRYMSGNSHLTRDARNLVRKVRHFRISFNNHNSYRHANRDFRAIKRSYYHLLRNYRQAHDAHHNRRSQHDMRYMKNRFSALRQALAQNQRPYRRYLNSHRSH